MALSTNCVFFSNGNGVVLPVALRMIGSHSHAFYQKTINHYILKKTNENNPLFCPCCPATVQRLGA